MKGKSKAMGGMQEQSSNGAKAGVGMQTEGTSVRIPPLKSFWCWSSMLKAVQAITLPAPSARKKVQVEIAKRKRLLISRVMA